MRSKLGVQVQNCHGLIGSWVVEDARPMTHALLIDPDVLSGNPWPWIETMGRLTFEQSPDQEMIQQGAVGAKRYFDLCAPRWAKCPWITIWHGPNEPYTGDPNNPNDLDPMKHITAFYVELAWRMHNIGLRVGGPVFGTGQPAGPRAEPLPTIEAKLRIFAEAARVIDAYVVHEYGMTTLEHTETNKWHIGTYKRAMQLWRSMGIVPPKVWVTEHGIDLGGDPLRDGWLVQLNGDEAEYMRQLAMRDEEYGGDNDVVAVLPFVWLDYNWPSFTITPSMSKRISAHVRANSAYVPPPEEANTVLQNGGFEEGFRRLSNEQEVANGWWPYYQDGPRDTGNGPYYNFAPEFKANDGSLYPSRTHGGRWSQQWFKLYGHYQAGIQQKVLIPERSRVTLRAWSQAWCSQKDDPTKSVDQHGKPAKLFRKVGIDPTGNAVFSRESVVWSPINATCDIWQEAEVTVECQGEVMLYLHAEPEWPFKHTDVYWDDVSLTVQPIGYSWEIERIAELLRVICAGVVGHAQGVAHNPDAALYKYAHAHNLGAYLFNESRERLGENEVGMLDLEIMGMRIRYQPYALGIVAVPVGQWDQVQHISW